jgi:hypothetical protein
MNAAQSSNVDEEALSQKRNVFRVPTDEQVIAPGEIQQLMVKLDMGGTLLGLAVGPLAKPVKLFAGRGAYDVPDDVAAWRPNLTVEAGKFIIVTVQNTGDEPAVFRALFFIDAPNHKIVVGTPQPVPPATNPLAAPMGLTQALPPGPTTTPADHGVKAGVNEIAMVVLRNDATFLLDHLRNNTNLPPNTKYTLIRRLDDVLKAKK